MNFCFFVLKKAFSLAIGIDTSILTFDIPFVVKQLCHHTTFRDNVNSVNDPQSPRQYFLTNRNYRQEISLHKPFVETSCNEKSRRPDVQRRAQLPSEVGRNDGARYVDVSTCREGDLCRQVEKEVRLRECGCTF